MATRLSVISTRTGDAGTTGLGDGQRVPKNDARVAAMGDVDELNSVIGLWRCESLPADVDALLGRIQHDLFDLGAELCIPGHTALHETHVQGLDTALAHYNASLGKLQEFILPGGSRPAALAHLARTVCRRAERAVVTLHRQTQPEPGTAAASTGTTTGATTNDTAGAGTDNAAGHTTDNAADNAAGHTAGTGTKANTEAGCGAVHSTDTCSGVNAPVLHYLNRLSDLCFVLARHLNRQSGGGDVLWQRRSHLPANATEPSAGRR
jgi:cob(I)alamin adenosyltransferase